MVILMSNDKPMNAMYGQKVKLDLDKIRNRRKEAEAAEEAVEEPVVEEGPVAEAVEETATEEVVEEAPVEEVVEEAPVEDAVEEVVEEPVVEEAPVEETATEEVVEEAPVEEAVVEPAEEVKEVPEKKPKKDNSKKVNDLKTKMANQSKELNYLTNTIIPNLKKENAELNRLKKELTDALEKTTRKYFDQLDINADLSNKIGKLGAESAVNKVRADKLETEIDEIKEDFQSKIDEYKEKLANVNVKEVEKENKQLSVELDEVKQKLADARKENIEASEEVDKLRAELIEVGNYKDEVDKQYKKEIEGYKEEISSLSTQLKVKESSYDKLSNESKSTISKLNNEIKKLEEELENKSNKGLFNRLR
jgi:uncharacterized phage infection (PIP) family protein YhgE